MTTRKLTERQVKWSQFMAEFSLSINFRAGKKAERPDALSRRRQDLPKIDDDPRHKEREFRLIKDEWLTNKPKQISPTVVANIGGVIVPKGSALFEDPEFQSL